MRIRKPLINSLTNGSLIFRFLFHPIKEELYHGTFDQLYHIKDEAREAISAFENESDDRVIEELLDVKWCVETELRHHSLSKVIKGYYGVIRKNKNRGYVTTRR